VTIVDTGHRVTEYFDRRFGNVLVVVGGTSLAEILKEPGTLSIRQPTAYLCGCRIGAAGVSGLLSSLDIDKLSGRKLTSIPGTGGSKE
jgi:hypothetical protein